MKSRILLTSLALCLVSSLASADVVSGSYTFGGTTTPTTQTGPWTMSTPTTADFAVLRFVPNVSLTFSQYTSLSYDYDVNAGGISGGSPRAVFVFNSGDTAIVHWGPPGSFVDLTTGTGFSTGNLLSLTDNGRYDLSGSGGSAYTDRTAALALVGNQTVNRISLVLDSFTGIAGGVVKEFVINGVNVQATAVPEPAAFIFGGAICGVLGLAIGGRRLWARFHTPSAA